MNANRQNFDNDRDFTLLPKPISAKLSLAAANHFGHLIGRPLQIVGIQDEPVITAQSLVMFTLTEDDKQFQEKFPPVRLSSFTERDKLIRIFNRK